MKPFEEMSDEEKNDHTHLNKIPEIAFLYRVPDGYLHAIKLFSNVIVYDEFKKFITERERLAFELRMGFNDGIKHTYHYIGTQIPSNRTKKPVCGNRVMQIFRKSLRIMWRHAMKACDE